MGKCSGLGCSTYDYLSMLVESDIADAKRTDLDFDEPKPVLHRTDSEAIRSRILSMTTDDARKLGIRRNTLWYLRERAKTGKFFKIYGKLETRLHEQSDTSHSQR